MLIAGSCDVMDGKTDDKRLQVLVYHKNDYSKGLLPICASCKSIRDDDVYFKTIETYYLSHSNLEFSHTVL